MPRDVLIFGSSHVKRINFQINESNLHFDKNNYTVMSHGISGLHINTNLPGKSINSHLRLVSLTKPDIIVIMCGSNDIANKKCDVSRLATDYIAIANYCLQAGVRRVVLLQVWPRSEQKFPGYFDRAVFFSECVSERLKGVPDILFWRQRGLWHSTKQTLLPDGTHLNAHGSKLFLRSIRGAIIQATKNI